MTIAVCLVTGEAVVFGTDSTITEGIEVGYHYLNHNQKIFEVGAGSSFGAMIWVAGSIGKTSFRSVFAKAADRQRSNPHLTPREMAQHVLDEAWGTYQAQFAEELQEFRDIENMISNTATNLRDEYDVEAARDRLSALNNMLRFGICLGGHSIIHRIPEAFYFEVDPTLRSPPSIRAVINVLIRGQNAYFSRMYEGIDISTRSSILESEFWIGSAEDFDDLMDEHVLMPPQMTARDSIDFVHFVVYSTIKVLKFSAKGQFCGGPIELAVITSDRPFRWVRHKEWDSAIAP